MSLRNTFWYGNGFWKLIVGVDGKLCVEKGRRRRSQERVLLCSSTSLAPNR
jgi:hypothetical protein